jgi:prepilin-type N-terminal cleavage/methylation domain-containing protein
MRVENGQGRSDGVHGMSPRRRFPRALGRKPRAGFTLVELLVAMMVFAVGMLGLAATAATVTKLMGGAKRQTIASTVAQSRMERLRSSPCGSLVAGTETSRGVVNKWTVEPITRGVNVTDTVTFRSARGVTYKVYKTTLPC